MEATDRLFAGNIPEVYDRLLVSVLFEPYARDLAERVAKAKPRRILETAAGTGALTRAIASRLPAQARIVATDLNQPMLDHGAAIEPRDDRITRQQADALARPFDDESFDTVACQFGVMFFPDKVQGYREAYRVLKPGGHFFFNVWDEIATNLFANLVTQTLPALFPKNPPDFMARTPHGYFDKERISEDLLAAGFGAISIETREEISRGASTRELAVAFCQGTPLRNEIEARDPARLDEAVEMLARAFVHRYGAGLIEGRMRAHIVTAVR
jgi:ubiquinone/menaquinone biosynthesis C-methylase UbiE